jgi:ribosomal protein S27AE
MIESSEQPKPTLSEMIAWLERAEKRIRFTCIAGIIVGIFLLAETIKWLVMPMAYLSHMYVLDWLNSPYMKHAMYPTLPMPPFYRYLRVIAGLLVVTVVYGLTFSIYKKKSKVFAIIMLLFWICEVLMAGAEEMWGVLGALIIVTLFFLPGLAGICEYHYIMRLANGLEDRDRAKIEKMKVVCPQCGRRLFGARRGMIGDVAECGKCKAEFTIE